MRKGEDNVAVCPVRPRSYRGKAANAGMIYFTAGGAARNVCKRVPIAALIKISNFQDLNSHTASIGRGVEPPRLVYKFTSVSHAPCS